MEVVSMSLTPETVAELRADLTAIRNRLETITGYGVLNANQRDAVESVRRRALVALERLEPAPLPPPPPDPPPVEPPPPPTVHDPLNPYPAHPVHRPIPADVQAWSGSAQAMGPHRAGLHLDTGYDSPGVYVAREGLPVWSLVLPTVTLQVAAPAVLEPGGGSDHPLVILLPDDGVEVRMWRARVDAAARRVTCGNGNIIRLGDHRVLEGGDVTGSGHSYTVGMVRPHEIARGHIPHALRISSSYIGGMFVPPATKTDQSGACPPEVPMGARAFLPADIDLTALHPVIDTHVQHPFARAAARTLLRAVQEYGLLYSDGAGFPNTVYLEGRQTADWEAVMGPPTGSYDGQPTYNGVGRAVNAAIPWGRMLVTTDPRLG